jgi:Transposase DDE domain
VAYTVDRPIGGRLYRYRVEGYRDPKSGKVRQRVLEYQGRILVSADGSKHLIPKRSRDPTVEQILPFGDLALLYDTAEKLDLAGTIDRLAPRPSGTPTGKAVLLLAINHLVGRLALDDVADWYDQTMLRSWMGRSAEEFTEDRLFGVLDSICHQEESWMWDKSWFISDALRRKAEELWGPEGRYVYYDRTQMLYHGENCYYAEFSAHGGTEDRRKIGMGVVVRRGDGFPVLYRVYRGNQVDVNTVGEVKSRLKAAGLERLIVVMDRGMASAETVRSLAEAGYDVVVGVRADEKIFEELVGSLTDDEVERPENRLRRGDRVFCAVERVKTVEGRRRKYVVYQDPRVRGEEKALLLRALEDREERLKEIRTEMATPPTGRGSRPNWEGRVREMLGGMGRYFEWSIRDGVLNWSVQEEAVRTSLGRLARCILMSTASGLSKTELVHAYLDKDEVEKVWRVGKGALGLMGVKHYKRDRVVSYLLVCYVAYLLWVAVRRRLRDAKIPLSPEKAMLQLRRVEMVRFRVGEKDRWDCPKAVGMGARLEKTFELVRWKAVVAK